MDKNKRNRELTKIMLVGTILAAILDFFKGQITYGMLFLLVTLLGIIQLIYTYKKAEK